MTQMIKNAEEQHVIEASDGLRRQLLDVHDSVIDLRAEQRARHVELFELDTVDRDNVSAPAFHFEAVPTGGRAHIQHALSAKILGDRKGPNASPKRVDADQSGDYGAIRKLQAMVAAMPGQLFNLLLRAAAKLRALRQTGSRHGAGI